MHLQGRWEHYYEFGTSSLTDAAGRRHPLPIADRPPGENVRTLKLPAGTPMPDRARHHPLVVRRFVDPVFGRELPVDASRAVTVDLRIGTMPSEVWTWIHVDGKIFRTTGRKQRNAGGRTIHGST